jgi:hypothetical protein
VTKFQPHKPFSEYIQLVPVFMAEAGNKSVGKAKLVSRQAYSYPNLSVIAR